jgi:hypothetical protein
MIGHVGYMESREKNLAQGMSSNCCLTRSDCRLRVSDDLEEANGYISQKLVAL